MDWTTSDRTRFAEQYQDPNITVNDLCRIWDAASGTIYRWGFEMGLKRPKHKGELQLAMEQVRQFCESISKELPPYIREVPKVRLEVGTGKAMDLILFLTDLHFGRLTVSFDSEVANNRMFVLAARLADLTALLRRRFTIHRLYIFALGDYVVGENVGRNIHLEELEHTILTQVYNLAVPQLVILTVRLTGTFADIEVHAVPGNHGIVNKFGASKSANWDTVAYYAWEARMGGHATKDVSFDIEASHWYKFVTVRNMDWLLIHGDQFPAGSGSPYNSVKAKLDRWHTSMPLPFDAVALGHFHQFAKIGEAWIGPTLLSDDDWSREVIGREGDCGQLVLGVTDEGVEFAWPIGLRDVGHYDD